VSAVSADSIWAVVGATAADIPGSDGSVQPRVLHWGSKGGWQAGPQPVLPAGANLTSVLAQAGGKVIAGGSIRNGDSGGTSPFTATLSGTTWTLQTLPGRSTTKWVLTQIVPDGRGLWSLAFAGNGSAIRLWHRSGATWSVVKPAFGGHEWILEQLSAIPHTRSAWGAGALRHGSGAYGLIAVAGPAPR
jgi:hypothetical protein